MLKIGNLKLKSNLILAPMAGITDFPFRMFHRQFGAELAFVEMINVRSLSYNSKKTKQMLFSSEKDTPLGVQILGCEEKYILRAIDILKEYKFDILDFNAACPVRKVTRRGEGSALLKEPKLLLSLLKIIVKNSDRPVTVKIRIGWDEGNINIKETAVICEDAGVRAIFVHGRTKEQGYRIGVNYQAMKQAKEAVKIPVIASGDIFNPELAKKMFDETGCDAVLAARGALGNPWIFKEIKEFLKSGKLVKRPNAEEISAVMLRHFNMYADFYGGEKAVILFRKFISWYTKGLPNICHLRQKASYVKTKEDMSGIITQVAYIR